MVSIPATSRRWAERMEALGFLPEVHVFPDGTRTAEDAALAIGCHVGAIVKSLVFLVDGVPTLALVPGDRRLDPGLLAAAAGGSKVTRAPLELVKEATGFAAGGTPPFGHDTPVTTFADEALHGEQEVWGACGTPTTVFPFSPRDLDHLTDVTWAPLSDAP